MVKQNPGKRTILLRHSYEKSLCTIIHQFLYTINKEKTDEKTITDISVDGRHSF